MEHAITLCSIPIFSYVDFKDLLSHLYQYNKMIMKSILYHIHRYKTSSCLYSKILSQTHPTPKIQCVPIIRIQTFQYMTPYLFEIFDNPNQHYEYELFLINKLSKIFFIKKINKNTILMLMELYEKKNIYCATISKNFHTPATCAYVYKDGKYTKYTKQIMELLKS